MPRFDSIRKKAYVDAISSGMWRTDAAAMAGVAYSTVWRHLQHDKALRDAVESAELDANTAVENALYRRALEGHVTACLAWLYSRMTDRWSDMRHTRIREEPPPAAKELSPQERHLLLKAVGEIRSDHG